MKMDIEIDLKAIERMMAKPEFNEKLINDKIRDITKETSDFTWNVLNIFNMAFGIEGRKITKTQRRRTTKKSFTIWNSSPLYIFVEYGTGITGKNSPHPNAGEDSYQYDVNSHGPAGWSFPEDKLNEGDLKVETDYFIRNGRVFTTGQPARPAMFKTYEQLEQEAETIAQRGIEELIS